MNTESLPDSSLSKDHSPIVAVASGSVDGAISILRFSGIGSHQLVARLTKTPFEQTPSHQQTWTKFYDPSTDEMIDDPMLTLFKGRKSYTGEDSGEVFFHASRYIIQRALKAFESVGFRLAEAGEFTRRAYLNGRLDLTEAEGIANLIHSETEQQWLAAKYLASGKLKGYVKELRTSVLQSMGWLEAKIDFPDEKETSAVEWQAVDTKLQAVQSNLQKLENTFQNGQIATNGLRVSLFGPPNAGKSTLMNTLLGKDRAIVTDIAGTTRDYLEEPCLIDGRMLRLIDTAGVHSSSDSVEKIGIARSLEIASTSDITLILIPANSSKHEVEKQKKYWSQASGQKIFVITKLDINKPEEHIRQAVSNQRGVDISCQNGHGIGQLQSLLKSMVDQNMEAVKDDFFITNYRHKRAVQKALAHLHLYFEGREIDSYEEMLAFELQNLAKSLAELIGHIDTEDVLDVVFSEFCVGK